VLVFLSYHVAGPVKVQVVEPTFYVQGRDANISVFVAFNECVTGLYSIRGVVVFSSSIHIMWEEVEVSQFVRDDPFHYFCQNRLQLYRSPALGHCVGRFVCFGY